MASCLLAVAAACWAAPIRAQEIPYAPRTTYGDLGMLEMPSARMAPDGEISGTIAWLSDAQRYNFAFQLTPWFEGTFRYSRISDIRGVDVLYDRSFGMKIRFSREDRDWPEISLGIRDLLGTGVYSSEYIVATKRLGDFDVTAGLGWGRLASVDTFPNPLGLIFPSFKKRPTFIAGTTGGTVNFGQFFHGPSMGLFGGVVWRSPVPDLDVIVEYSSDDYTEERAGGGFKPRIPVNAGLSYRFLDTITVSAGWYYGTGYGVTLNFAANPAVDLSPQRFGAEVPAPVIRPVESQVNALSALLAPSRPVSSALPPNAPWVQLPVSPSNPDSMALASALMSMGEGVHDVDVAGRTVMIDAHLTRLASRQCDRYAEIVSALDPKLETVAVSDLDDASGMVAICNITHKFIRTADAGDSGGSDAPPVPPVSDAPPDNDPVAAEKKIREDVAGQSIGLVALSLEPTTVWLYFDNRKYYSEAEAAGRIARVLMADAPSKIEIFHIVSVRGGVFLRDFQIARSALERATLAYGSANELGDALTILPAPVDNPALESAQSDAYPKLHWAFKPGMRTGFFDPTTPLQLQLLVTGQASVDLTPNLTFETSLEANIYNNYDLSRNSNSQLPHVRSDLNKYYAKGINGISNLDAVYRTRIGGDAMFEAKLGYLEDMFAGGGAQFLWRPEGDRFAFGVDLYEVWKRSFDRLFGVQNYHVLTGHATVYYQSPWYGLNFAVHAGRYLAGDYGATVEVSREFSTGVEIGAFATFTNVPFSKFGEGSFDKGIIIHIPLEWAVPFFSASAYDARLRSLVRDGGQRLDGDDSLFAETRANSYGEVIGHLDDVVAP